MYYAICNANGPISKRLDTDDKDSAIIAFGGLDQSEVIDAPATDIEDDCDFCGENMSEDEFEIALNAAGCIAVEDLDPIHNYQAGTTAHLAGGWYLWRKP